MYPRQSNNFPSWLVVVTGFLLVFGGYYVWHGFTSFMQSDGNIAGPETQAVRKTQQWQTATVEAKVNQATFEFENLRPIATRTPAQACQDFRVSVVRARIRECPNETCETLNIPGRGMLVCVIGVAKEASDWYQVNLSPNDPLAQFGYMHSSVLDPVNPTPKPTRSFTPLPTVTEIPTEKPTQTPIPPPSELSNPAAPSATWTPSPTFTPEPPLQTA